MKCLARNRISVWKTGVGLNQMVVRAKLNNQSHQDKSDPEPQLNLIGGLLGDMLTKRCEVPYTRAAFSPE